MRPAATTSWTGGRVALLVVGAVLAVTSLGLLGAGGTALWADQTQRDGDGYVTSDTRTLSTATSALVAEPLDVTLDRAGDALWLRRTLGTVRVEVQAAGRDVFVGLARSSDVERYLRGVGLDRVTDVSGDEVSYERRSGTAVPAPPAEQQFWVASAGGAGALDLEWEVQGGRWTVVVMAPEAAPGVTADVRVGVTAPVLLELAIGLVAAGAVLLAAGAALLVVATAGTGRTHPPAGPELPAPRAPQQPTPRTSAPYGPGPLL